MRKTFFMLLMAGAVVATSVSCKKGDTTFKNCETERDFQSVNIIPPLEVVRQDVQQIMDDFHKTKHRSVEKYLKHLTDITEETLDLNNFGNNVNLSNEAYIFLESLNNFNYEGELSRVGCKESLIELLNNSSIHKGSYEYNSFVMAIDLTTDLYFIYFHSDNENVSVAKALNWRCSAGIIGSVLTGVIHGTAVGTVTLPGIGSISGAAVGAVAGAFIGAATFC